VGPRVERQSGPWRFQRLTVGIFLGAVATSCLAFFLAKASVEHDDQLLLLQNASQASLVLSPYISDYIQPSVTGAEAAVGPSGVDPAAWQTAASAVTTKIGASGAALVRAVSGHLEVVATSGSLHGAFGSTVDATMAGALLDKQTPFDGFVTSGKQRWLTELLGLPTLPAGYGLYTEIPFSSPDLFSLSSLPGHPFSNIEGAGYVGREDAQDLLFSTTRHLPLTGQRAVTVLSMTGENSSPAHLNSRAGSVSSPGRIIVVLRATASLTGTVSSLMPWILLIGLLGASVVVAVLFEVGARRRLQQRRNDARFVAMVRSSSDLTTVVAADGTILYQSPSSRRLLGKTPEEMLATNFSAYLDADDLVQWHSALTSIQQTPGAERTAQWRLHRDDGEPLSVESRLTNLLDDPAVAGIVLNSRDVSERIRLESDLRHQAFHDSLTGLANRALFQDRLQHAVERLDRTGGAIGVLFLDLDNFKAVNDGRGHGAGDNMLRAAAERLRGTVRTGDTLARLGGDEFAVLLESTDPAMPRNTAERILDALRLPFPVPGGEGGIRASVGIVVATDPGIAPDELLRDADIAMYAAKSAGKDRSETFHPGLHRQVISRLQLEADLARALEDEELAVHYQPIVDLSSGEVRGVEALMRWNHPHRGLLLPAEFIPIAESTGLIVPMGRWLFRRACLDVRALQQHSERFDLCLAVNLSTRQLDEPALVAHVSAALEESGLPPDLLTLEITESVLMTHPERAAFVLERLKELGVKVAIDDFGTGYSSLSYLQRLPVDELKIDRTFVANESLNPESSTLLDHIVRLAEELGLETVAEGIETEKQKERLRAAGCHLAQGYLFARPADLSQVQQLLGLTPTRTEPGKADPRRSRSSRRDHVEAS
jgi:diguanylate cyclase (GGDEF)-like protein/PAS domain S-box-containing protein